MDKIWCTVYELKESIAWHEASRNAKMWWNEFENDMLQTPTVIKEFIEELHDRQVTLEEAFLAYVYTDTDSLEKVLAFIDLAKRLSINRPLRDKDFLKAARSYHDG